MKPAPCKKNGIMCEKRTAGCMEKCEEFLAWRKYLDGIKEERNKELDRNKPIGRRYRR